MSTLNTEFILVLLFINRHIIYLYYNCKPTFAHTCISIYLFIDIDIYDIIEVLKNLCLRIC